MTVTRVVLTRKLSERSKAKANIIALNKDFWADVKLPLAWYIFTVAICRAVKRAVAIQRSSRRRNLISSLCPIFIAWRMRGGRHFSPRNKDQRFCGPTKLFRSTHFGRKGRPFAASVTRCNVEGEGGLQAYTAYYLIKVINWLLKKSPSGKAIDWVPNMWNLQL